MRKLKLQTQLSVDGFVAGPNGEMDWLVWNWDDRLNDHVNALMESVDLILLGRVLADGFIPTWTERLKSDASDQSARWMVETPKVVFTHTLEESPWEYTTLAKGDLAEEIRRLKDAPGGDIIAYGGARFVSELVRHGLIDEYHLFVNPTAIGAGMTIFSEPDRKIALKLMESTAFDCGIVSLFYTPSG